MSTNLKGFLKPLETPFLCPTQILLHLVTYTNVFLQLFEHVRGHLIKIHGCVSAQKDMQHISVLFIGTANLPLLTPHISIDLFHIMQKYNIIIRICHFGRQVSIILTRVPVDYAHYLLCGWML